MRNFVILLILIVCILCFFSANDGFLQYDQKEYGVFLSVDNQKMEELKDYKTVVIDAAYFNKEDIDRLKQAGHTVYTYLNIGSLENFRPYYKEYSKYTLGEYKNWEEEEWIDVSQKQWQKLICGLADEYEEKGVDGFFIDNCDVYYLYKQDKIYNGLVDILSQLKDSGLDVIINGGDSFISKYYGENKNLNKILTGINQETVFSSIDFEKKRLGYSSNEEKEYFISYLNKMNQAGAAIYLLEYTSDKKLEKQIQKYCTKKGWKYYISDSVELD